MPPRNPTKPTLGAATCADGAIGAVAAATGLVVSARLVGSAALDAVAVADGCVTVERAFTTPTGGGVVEEFTAAEGVEFDSAFAELDVG
jgi:hypothetical protein